MARYGLILIWLFAALTGYAQNQRVTSLTSGTGGITNSGPLRQIGPTKLFGPIEMTNALSARTTNYFGRANATSTTNRGPVWVDLSDTSTHISEWVDHWGRRIFHMRRDIANPITNSVAYFLNGQDFGALTFNIRGPSSQFGPGEDNHEARFGFDFTDVVGGAMQTLRLRPRKWEFSDADSVGLFASGVNILTLSNDFMRIGGSSLGGGSYPVAIASTWTTNEGHFVAVSNTLFQGGVRYLPQTNFFSGTTNVFIDVATAGYLVRFTATNNFGIHFTNVVAADSDGKEFRIEVKQDATGNRIGAMAGPSNWRFGTDITGFTFTTNAAYIDQIKVVVRGTNVFAVGFLRGFTD